MLCTVITVSDLSFVNTRQSPHRATSLPSVINSFIFAWFASCPEIQKKHQPEKKSFHHELVCVQLPTSADSVALPTFGRRTSLLRHGCCWAPAVQQTVQQSIDIYCLPTEPTAANPQQRRADVKERTYGRPTDTWTCSAYYAGSANNLVIRHYTKNKHHTNILIK